MPEKREEQEKMNSKEMQDKDKEYIMGTYGRNNLCIANGKGDLCFSPEGDAYIDFSSGIGVNSLGFANDVWVEAITKQANTLQHTSNLFYTAPCVELAELLVKRSGLEKIFFSNSGAEANEGAIKTARKYSFKKYGLGRHEIITLVNSFHGRTMATITATGQDGYHTDFFPFVEGFSYAKANDMESLNEKINEKTCAIMIELVQGEGGVIALEKEYVETISKLCVEKDILLIVDEVQTGIGRTGTLFAYEQFEIKPDLVTVAKGLGGGLPIGGVLFGEKTYQVLAPGDHGTTFGGNPIACAGGVAILKTIDALFLKEVSEKGHYIKEKLEAMDGVELVSGLGLMIGILPTHREAKDIVAECLKKGLILLTAKEKVRMLPPLNISYAHIEQGLHILETVLQGKNR